MKTNYVGKKNFLLLSLFAATAINARGQSEFFGLPASSYIDNIADSEAIQLGSLAKPLAETANENRFWTMRKITATYSFEHEDSRPGDFASSDSHAFVPELYLESANGWSLNVGALYAHTTDREDFTGFLKSKGKLDTFEISVQPAYDVLSFWNHENRPQFIEQSKLIAGLGLAYVHEYAEVRSRFFFGSPFSFQSEKYETDGYLLNPNLVFVHPLSEKFITFLIPAYRMTWSDRAHAPDSDYGQFNLTARGDYKLTERLFASAFATWKRDITSNPKGIDSDWAEFGGQLRFAISQRLTLRAGYSYEAFDEFFEEHHCFARLEANF